MNADVKFEDSGSNLSRDIRRPHFVTDDNDNDAGRWTPDNIAKRRLAGFFLTKTIQIVKIIMSRFNLLIFY